MQSLDYEKIVARASEFIRARVKIARAKGVIFGLSGGIDSAVVAYLCKQALGADKCMAVIMPNSDFTPESETRDGIMVAEKIGVKYMMRPIRDAADVLAKDDEDGDLPTEYNHKIVTGNLNARIRTVILYYEGQKRNYLVVGTDDKSEYMIGYFTKYGDGASDILPIAQLYKTHVKRLAEYLGVPDHIILKKSSPHLWKDHSADHELGMDYEDVDKILAAMTDSADADEISVKTGIDLSSIKTILALNQQSEHKRHMPPIAELFSDNVGNNKDLKHC